MVGTPSAMQSTSFLFDQKLWIIKPFDLRFVETYRGVWIPSRWLIFHVARFNLYGSSDYPCCRVVSRRCRRFRSLLWQSYRYTPADKKVGSGLGVAGGKRRHARELDDSNITNVCCNVSQLNSYAALIYSVQEFSLRAFSKNHLRQKFLLCS